MQVFPWHDDCCMTGRDVIPARRLSAPDNRQSREGNIAMKELVIIAVITMFAIGFTMTAAGGGKNQGTTGSGEIYTGITAVGEASQPRVGR